MSHAEKHLISFSDRVGCHWVKAKVWHCASAIHMEGNFILCYNGVRLRVKSYMLVVKATCKKQMGGVAALTNGHTLVACLCGLAACRQPNL